MDLVLVGLLWARLPMGLKHTTMSLLLLLEELHLLQVTLLQLILLEEKVLLLLVVVTVLLLCGGRHGMMVVMVLPLSTRLTTFPKVGRDMVTICSYISDCGSSMRVDMGKRSNIGHHSRGVRDERRTTTMTMLLKQMWHLT